MAFANSGYDCPVTLQLDVGDKHVVLINHCLGKIARTLFDDDDGDAEPVKDMAAETEYKETIKGQVRLSVAMLNFLFVLICYMKKLCIKYSLLRDLQPKLVPFRSLF